MTRDARYERTLNRDWSIRASDAGISGAAVSSPGYDTHHWLPAAVPSTVLAALVAHGRYPDPYVGMNLKEIPAEPFQSPWWYRTEFALSDAEAARTVLLEFDGINYAADVWLNGARIAIADEVRGAFRRFQTDISAVVKAGANALAVEVVPPGPGDFSTGFVDWNVPPPDRNMGLFRPVRLRFCDGVAIEHPFVQTRVDLETLAEAELTVSADLVNHRPEPVTGMLEGHIEDVSFRQEVRLEPGQTTTVVFAVDEYPQLRFAAPRLWWPHDLGTPELYRLDLQFVSERQCSDARSIRFGVRDVADYRTVDGHRGFAINGHKLLIRGAGWTDDLLLADTSERVDAQLQYVRHMNLNCIRCEGVWGTDQTLYDLCDTYGILVMAGWSCHWEHEQYLGAPVDERYGGIVTPEAIDLMSRSWRDQLLWLRHHPSIFVWAVASDKVPAPDLERRYIETFETLDPSRPTLASTGGVGSDQHIIGSAEIVSDVSGDSGVKMLGPYAYTPPVYWYTDTQRGGAYGFNTETSPGAAVPGRESVRKMIPPDHLWPIDACWDFHCGLNEFATLDRYRQAIERRYSEPASLEEFDKKAQALNYELMRPMFEAFRANQGRATGIIQWMLNAAWPKMYWQLYDWYLMPTGAFYGAKKACAPVHLSYDYGDNSIALVNDRLSDTEHLRADIRLYDSQSRLFLAVHFPIEAEHESVQRIFTLPAFETIRGTYFLNLRLLDADHAELENNFYWLSTRPDVLDYEAVVEPWEYYTPSKHYADFRMLNSLAPADVSVQYTIDPQAQHPVSVELDNRSDRIAFGIELLLTDPAGEPIVPVFWQDNFVSLLPREKRTLRAAAGPRDGAHPTLTVRGWNIQERRCVEPDGPASTE